MDTLPPETAALLGGRRLLAHPFYRRWEDGDLAPTELAAYAAQYRHVEAALPDFLIELVGRLDDPAARALVAANLRDEVAGPETHLEAFERFAAAVGAGDERPTPATTALLDLYQRSVRSASSDFALGVLAGYEVQAAEVARTKGDSLAARYGIDADGRAFWDLHAGLEDEHAAWTLAAAGGVDGDEFVAGARASAAAWWSFLDEREALAAA
jgi:pyrroloquinoline-quinone synthase